MDAKADVYAPDNLKIMIVSTPKTGNTWVKHLLSHIYGLPMVDVGLEFKVAEVDALGPRWITHQHYGPRADLTDWAERNDVVFVTTIRHPGDVLVSMFHFFRHHIKHLKLGDNHPMKIMVRDGDVMGKHTATFLTVAGGFAVHLDISLRWIRAARTRVVRYEDLWRDPMTALRDLTASIREVSLDRIEHAIELCDIDLMRSTLPGGSMFYRRGSVGDWKALPQEIVDILRHNEPYPSQFAELGYTLDRDDPLTTLPRKPWISRNPFQDITHFDNGVPVPSIAVRLYLSLKLAQRRHWPALETTTPDSFYAWLNAPTDEDPCEPGTVPIVTNLAEYIFRSRPDIHELFPDIFGKDRNRLVAWLQEVRAEYGLDQVFVAPMEDALLAWSGMPAVEDPYREKAAPTLTNLAVHIYHLRPDLQAMFPDLFGKDRRFYAHWFIKRARAEHGFSPKFAESIRCSERVISRTLPERGSIVRSFMFSLRQKLFWLLRK